jgi:hypothetical protein
MELQGQAQQGEGPGGPEELLAFSGDPDLFAPPREISKEGSLSFNDEPFPEFSQRKESEVATLLPWQDFRRAYDGPWVTGRSESWEDSSWEMAM